MTEAAITNTLTHGDQPGPNETVHGCEQCALLSHEMLLSSGDGMAVVRVFGADSTRNAVRLGFTPARAMRIGAAFIRAAMRLDPSLRADVLDPAAPEDKLANVLLGPAVTAERSVP